MSIYRTGADELPLGADNILDLCLRLRMASNGIADPFSTEEKHEALAYLRRRLIHWTPSISKASERFDKCARQLVCAAVDEVEAQNDWRLSQYQIKGVGVPMVPHPKGAECPACLAVYYDPRRVDTPCPNLLCPDRRVGAAAGGA